MRLFKVPLGLLCVLLATTACNKNTAPPAALTVEQLPAAFDKAFAKAKPEVRGMATEVISSVQAKAYAKAHSQIQMLATASDLTKEQSSVVGRGMLTISSLMQAAAAQGDENAAQAVKVYRSNK